MILLAGYQQNRILLTGNVTIIITPKPPVSKPYGTGSGMGYDSFNIFVIGDEEAIKEEEEVIMLVLQLFVRLWE